MAIQFEFYKNPQPEKEGEEPSYHPRVVNFQHVTTQRLAREIHMATTSGWNRLFSNHAASYRTHTLAYHPRGQSKTKIHQFPG